MSRITGNEVKNLMEAYNAVYAPQELTEEQVWEEVENWVNSLLEEGYDLSDYTWEEMYEAYMNEDAARAGASFRQTFGNVRRAFPGFMADRGREVVSNITRPASAVWRASTEFGRGFGTGGAAPKPEKPSQPSSTQSRFAGSRDAAFDRARQIQGSPVVGSRPSSTAPAGTPTASRPASGAPKPTPSATRPAAPAATQTGDKVKDMATWAKANPTLAAAAAEKARIRGTQQTDNPLMKDMRSRLPMNSPSVQSPDVAKLGKGNQSLTQNPNAFKAAAPKPAATPTPPVKPVTPTAAVSAAPSTSPTASGSVAPATAKIAARPSSAMAPDATRRARLNMEMEYDAYDIVLEYLLSQGHVETLEEALYVMMEMNADTIQGIVEQVTGDGSGKPMHGDYDDTKRTAPPSVKKKPEVTGDGSGKPMGGPYKD